MGPLTRLFIGKRGMDPYFAKDGDRFVVYPYWIFGNGFRIDSGQREPLERLNSWVLEALLWGALLFCGTLVYVTLQTTGPGRAGFYVAVAVFGVFVGGLSAAHFLVSRKVLAGSERTPKRMTLGDHLAQAAAHLSWPRAIIGLVSVIIVNLMPALIIVSFPQLATGLGLLEVGVAQLVLLALLWIHARIVIRKRQGKADTP